MIEKRFTLEEFGLNFIVNDNGRNLTAKQTVDRLNELNEENEELKSENKRLTDKLNKTALELVDECISQGKATEISEMSYREFLDYRAENGKPMELQL